MTSGERFDGGSKSKANAGHAAKCASSQMSIRRLNFASPRPLKIETAPDFP
jgi:hypothetical protein